METAILRDVLGVASILFYVVATMPMVAWVPFLAGQRSVRITASDDAVVLCAWDPEAMLWVGGALLSGAALLYVVLDLGLFRGAALVVLALVVTCGLRVTVRAERGRTRVVRSLFGVLPWGIRSFEEPPSLYVDGWGDEADPEALHFACEDLDLELCWNSRDSGVDLDALAERFHRATAALGL